MRFLLDNMVDHEVLGCLTRLGHEAFAIAEVGSANANDDVVAITADEKNAVVVTHDKAFAQRQRRNTTVRMIYLTCDEWQACEVLTDYLADLVPILAHRPHVVIRCGTDSYTVHKPRWR